MGLPLILALGVGAMLFFVAGKEAKAKKGGESATEIEGIEASLAAEVDRVLATATDPAVLETWAAELEMLGLAAANEAARMLRERAEVLRTAAEAPAPVTPEPGEPPAEPPAPTPPRPGPPPTQDELDQWASAGDQLVNYALTNCPDQSKRGAIMSANTTFALDIISDPQVAYATLERTLQALCGPDIIILTPPVIGPPPPSGDPNADLANAVRNALANVGCMNVDPVLITEFQNAMGVAPTGVYDIDTAVALAPLVSGLPPGPCRFPGWEAGTSPQVGDAIAQWVARLEQLAGPPG